MRRTARGEGWMYTPHRALHDGRQVFLAPAGACQFGQGAGGFKTNLISSFTRGLSVALGGKTPKKLGWAPRVRTAKPKTRQKRAGYAMRMPGRNAPPVCGVLRRTRPSSHFTCGGAWLRGMGRPLLHRGGARWPRNLPNLLNGGRCRISGRAAGRAGLAPPRSR